MANLDLNELRNTLRENARRREAKPGDLRRRIVVDRAGKILHGSDLGLTDRRELSEVPQQVFAGVGAFLSNLFAEDGKASSSGPGVNRLARDRAVVNEKLPHGTTEVTVEGTTGFMYQFTDEFGESYTMVVYFDGTEYQVKVVFPEIEGQFGVASSHIFNDGRLCLRPPCGGMPTLDEAYAKSVLWANGFTIRRQTGSFPWPSH